MKTVTAQKVSVFGAILVRIQSECGKMLTRITPNTDTFHAVCAPQRIHFIQVDGLRPMLPRRS